MNIGLLGVFVAIMGAGLNMSMQRTHKIVGSSLEAVGLLFLAIYAVQRLSAIVVR